MTRIQGLPRGTSHNTLFCRGTGKGTDKNSLSFYIWMLFFPLVSHLVIRKRQKSQKVKFSWNQPTQRVWSYEVSFFFSPPYPQEIKRLKNPLKAKHTDFSDTCFPFPPGSCILKLNGNKAFLVSYFSRLSDVVHKTPGALLTTDFTVVFNLLE